MNGHEDDVWLDTLLQRQLPAALSDEGFRERLARRLPPRERPWLRAFALGLSVVVALAAVLLLPLGESMAVATSAGDWTVPSCLGAALVWYLADCLP
jgi:hypothetical protein